MERIAVVYGGPSAEHDISILTGLQSERILTRAGFDVAPVYWDRGGVLHLVPNQSEARDYLAGAPAKSVRLEARVAGADSGLYQKAALSWRKVEIGAAFLALHGGLGEGGGVQALFEILGIPCTGSTPQAAALGMDKLAFGAVLEQAGLPVLPRWLVDADSTASFGGPYIVKPRFGGSSIGIEIVDDVATARALASASPHMRAGAVAEPYRTDLYDVNVAFFTHPEFTTSLIERPLRSEDRAIYDYAGKYIAGAGLATSPRELPANIPTAMAESIDALAKSVQTLTGLTGVCRLDFLTNGTDLYVNEVNSIPGAMALYLWPDLPPEKILGGMIEEAHRMLGRAPTGSFEEGAALRAAGGIAGKLTGLGPRA